MARGWLFIYLFDLDSVIVWIFTFCVLLIIIGLFGDDFGSIGINHGHKFHTNTNMATFVLPAIVL